MIFDVQRKLTDLNKRVFDLENLLAGLGPTTTILDLLSPPPFIPWQPTPETPHELGGPRHTGVGDGLERDGTDLRVDEDAEFAWTAAHVFNEGGADVNFRIEAVGEPNAVFLDGGTGKLGFGTSSPDGEIHLYRTSNEHHGFSIDAQGVSSLQTADLNLITLGDGTKGLGNAATLGWHITARGNAFTTTAQQNDVLWAYWDGSIYKNIFFLDHAGAVRTYEDSAWTRLSGTKEFVWTILSPVVGTYGQIRVPWDCTVTLFEGNTIAGTSCALNVEERTTRGSSGTNVLSTDMVADANGEEVTSGFNNASLTKGNFLTIDVSAVTGSVEEVNISLVVTLT